MVAFKDQHWRSLGIKRYGAGYRFEQTVPFFGLLLRTEKRNPLCLCFFPDLAIFDLKFLCQFFVL